jgi:hypothetical protein
MPEDPLNFGIQNGVTCALPQITVQDREESGILTKASASGYFAL